jgi:hypothetical protein
MVAKQCKICCKLRPIFDFYLRKSRNNEPYSYCKECSKKKSTTHRQTNKEHYKIVKARYIERNIDRIKKYRKTAYTTNKDYYKYKCKERRLLFPEKYRKYNRVYVTTRLENDPLFKLKKNIRGLITVSIKGSGLKKKAKTEQILGCSFNEFKKHIETQFSEGMNWNNRHKWHIDHIIPMAAANTEEEVIKLNHYTNLQPLWAEENLAKGKQIAQPSPVPGLAYAVGFGKKSEEEELLSFE